MAPSSRGSTASPPSWVCLTPPSGLSPAKRWLLMEIAALSSSRLSALLCYQRSRFPAGIYLPLALFLCTAAAAAGHPVTLANFPGQLLLAGLLLFQFRLWDDLSDR